MEPTLWYIREGESPLVATAIHTGHEIRHEVAETPRLAVSQTGCVKKIPSPAT